MLLLHRPRWPLFLTFAICIQLIYWFTTELLIQYLNRMRRDRGNIEWLREALVTLLVSHSWALTGTRSHQLAHTLSSRNSTSPGKNADCLSPPIKSKLKSEITEHSEQYTDRKRIKKFINLGFKLSEFQTLESRDDFSVCIITHSTVSMKLLMTHEIISRKCFARDSRPAVSRRPGTVSFL